MRVLGIIPARGGSKGVPRKNVRPLAGRPLLAYTADAALGAKSLTRTILTTDDPEIAQVGRDCGLDVPFLRPAELAQDDTPTKPVLQHAVRCLEAEGERWDAICLLQPTNPLRGADVVDACVRMFVEREADAVVTVLAVPPEYNPHWVYFQDESGSLRISTGEAEPIPRRQALPPAFHREGSVYVMRRDVLMERDSLFGERLFGYALDPSQSVNIDTPADWAEAERLLTTAAATPF
ncbi:MAG: cytidylyltransferase domain-containing protein [Armatimonadota bacterium]